MKILKTHDYVDEFGKLLYQKVRVAHEHKQDCDPDCAKEREFKRRRSDDKGGLIWNWDNVRLVLYRLNKLIKCNDYVFVCEGESDVEAIESLGFIATTNPESGSTWNAEYADFFDSTVKGVFIFRDQDETGLKHGIEVAQSLNGRVPFVKIIDVPHGKDVREFLAGMEPNKAVKALWDLCERAQAWRSQQHENIDAIPPKPQLEAFALDEAMCNLGSLTNESDLDEIKQRLRQITSLAVDVDELERVCIREKTIQALKKAGISSPAKWVDSALNVQTSKIGETKQGTLIVLREPEPWAQEVDGAELLNEIVSIHKRFVVMPDEAVDASTLWCLFSYVHDAFEVSPILAITSPEKQCGKSTLREVHQALDCKPLPSSNVTVASLFRCVEQYKPTLLIDEADTFLNSDELRGILNSGHKKSGAVILRTVGEDYEPRMFSTWCPKSIALIGRLPATLEDRSIVISMKRKGSREKTERLSLASDSQFQELRMRMGRWASDHLEALQCHTPKIPESIGNRQADNWTPLLAIGDLIGGEWPERARKAAGALCEAISETENSAKIQLLADMKGLFDGCGSDQLTSSEIVAALGKMEDRPWPEWKSAKAITVKQLAGLLKPFGISPKTIRIKDNTAKGYKLEDFIDTFGRYIPILPVTPSQVATKAGFSQFLDPSQTPNVTDGENGQDEPPARVVTDVTDQKPESKEEDVTFEPL